MPKHDGPEEFFEALRSARKDRQPRQPIIGSGQVDSPAEEPEERKADAPNTTPSVDSPASSGTDPVIRLRRSTLVFAIIMAIVIVFIAYAVGRSAHGETPSPSLRVSQAPVYTTQASSLLPVELRGKSAIFMKEFDYTQDASRANALAYCKYLNETPDSAFIVKTGKRSFILSVVDQRKLVVCVGPFNALAGPDIDALLPKVREIRFNGVKPFRAAYAATLPPTAKICE